jgi:hypothetical protein
MGGEGLLPLLVVAALAGILLKAHHACQIDLGEASLTAPEGFAARTQFLRKPVASGSPFERVPDCLRMDQELVESVPDEGLHLLGRDKAGLASGVPVEDQRRELAAAGEVTDAAADQLCDRLEWEVLLQRANCRFLA